MIEKNNKSILLIHVLFWAVYFCFFMYQLTPKRDDFGLINKPKMMLLPPSEIKEKPPHREGFELREPPSSHNAIINIADVIIHVLTMIILAYSNYFLLLPAYLNKKISKIGYFTKVSLLFAACIFSLILLKSLLRNEFLDFENSLFFKTSFIIELSLSALFILLFISLLKFLENYVEVEKQKKDIENERLRNELALLKAQINPHFLFNAFNNLYALAIQNAPQTPQIIEKLAQIMRYTLYESNRLEVSLQKEITLIENIIALERLHLGESGRITFEKEVGDINPIKIAPMILITFLENAFKHGSKGAKTSVEISLLVQNNVLIYDIKNGKETLATIVEKSGIGLKNAQRQLELYYQNRYTLDIIETDKIYHTQLKINLL